MAYSKLFTMYGQAYAMLVTTANVTGPLTITGNPLADSCYLLNPSSTSVAVSINQITQTAPPQGFKFPTNNSPSIASCVILPPSMPEPMQVRVPNGGFTVWAIGPGASITFFLMPSTIQS